MELPRVGSSCSSSSKIGSQGGTQFGVIGVQHLREAWGWACSHLIALFAQICFTHHTHTRTRTHLKNTTRFFFFGIFYRGKNTLGVRLTVRRVRRALIRPVTSGPIALFNLSSPGKWVVWQRPPQPQVLPPLHSPLSPFHAYATAVIEAPNELPSAAFRTQSESHLMLSISVCTHSTLALPRFPIPSCLPV